MIYNKLTSPMKKLLLIALLIVGCDNSKYKKGHYGI